MKRLLLLLCCAVLPAYGQSVASWNSVNASWNGILTTWGATSTAYTRSTADALFLADRGGALGAHQAAVVETRLLRESAQGRAAHQAVAFDALSLADRGAGAVAHFAAASEGMRLLETAGGGKDLITWNGINATWSGTFATWASGGSGSGTLYTRSASDLLAILDSAVGVKTAAGVTYSRTVTEYLLVSEKPLRVAFSLQTSENSVGFGSQASDAALAGLFRQRSAVENLLVSDGAAAAAAHFAAVSESIATQTKGLLQLGLNDTASDSVPVFDFAIGVKNGGAQSLSRAVSELLAIGDAASGYGAHFTAVSQPLSLSDFAAGLKNAGIVHYTQAVSERLVIRDLVYGMAAHLAVASELLPLGESRASSAAHFALASELLPLGEQLLPYAAHYGVSVEGLHVSDSASRHGAISVSTWEVLVFRDAATGGYRLELKKRGAVIN